MFIYFIFFMILSILLIFFNLILNIKSYFLYNKFSMFECGFDPLSLSRAPFSLQFFKICLIFIFFDIEIILILPINLIFKTNYWIFLMILFLIIIIYLGLVFEWFQGSLNWMK